MEKANPIEPGCLAVVIPGAVYPSYIGTVVQVLWNIGPMYCDPDHFSDGWLTTDQRGELILFERSVLLRIDDALGEAEVLAAMMWTEASK